MNGVVPQPSARRLRGYAFDPSLSTRLETAAVNEVIFRVPWEQDLKPGPVGEYLEVVDYDPASGGFYEPVDLNHPWLLAQDGLSPSEGTPQYHQQMVYAVAMTTIRHFELALGRRALWASHLDLRASEGSRDGFVQQLRVYPHGLREANAFYSPDKKALLFGYFRADEEDGVHLPGGTVFTCLSHDIIAHETTHALLDGMHRRFIEPTHPDALAFHEAFADLVALFQHFSYPEVLRHQIARTRGNLSTRNLLAELAQEFGRALGRHGALRSAIGSKPAPAALREVVEPHTRGSILVAAVFDAFLAIYNVRASRAIRLATGGSGVLAPGALPPSLVETLAGEAAKTANHFLGMCIRALDYCPPVDINFGDYLRALITADSDLVPHDPLGYRVALIEAFRERGIFPENIPNLSGECVRWPGSDYDAEWLSEKLRGFQPKIQYAQTREQLFERTREWCGFLHDHLSRKGDANLESFGAACGLALTPRSAPPGIRRKAGMPVFEVHSLRSARRASPDGTMLNQVVVAITQKCQMETSGDLPAWTFRGGCTLILDLDSLRLQYCITKSIRDDAQGKARRQRQESFLRDGLPPGMRAAFCGGNPRQEPFALLHAGEWEGDDHA